MKNIDTQWKTFNVNLDMVNDKVKVLAPNKTFGISADTDLTVHCDDSITDAQVLAIQSYLDGIIATSDEAKSYRSLAQVKAAIETLKAGIPAKTWAQMSTMERGMLIGLTPSAADLIAASLL
jgi:hypothetical protein